MAVPDDSYRSIIEGMNEVAFMLDEGGRYIYISPAIENVTGYRPEEVLGRHFSELDFIEDAEKFATAIVRKKQGRAELRLRHKNGSCHYVRAARVAGDRETISGILSDMTAQQLACQAIAESDKKYRMLAENTSDMIWTMDVNMNTTYVSPAVRGLLGESPEEHLKRRLEDKLPPESLAKIIRLYAEEMRKENDPNCDRERSARLDMEHYRADGSRVWVDVNVSIIRDSQGKPVGFHGVTRDISARKRAEEALVKSEERYRLIAENMQDFIWLVDADLRFTYASPSVESLTGYSPEEILDMSLKDLFAPESLRRVTARFGKAQARGRDKKRLNDRALFEILQHKKNGDPQWVEVAMKFIRDEQDRIASIQGVSRDMTARKQAEDELKRAKKYLESVNRELEKSFRQVNRLAIDAEIASIAKSEFLANMSHEFRTPMNGVIGMVDLLLDTELSANQRRYAEVIRRSGEALLTIVNDILDFSKIEAGKMELERLDFDLRLTLEELVGVEGYRAREKGLAFNCLMNPDVPALLRGDPGRIRQILVNLIGNAIKFTARGGISVLVSLADETARRTTIRFAVKDTGIGIAADKIAEIFNAFTQEDASVTRKYGGTGLGLAISKKLTEMMGGRIGVESRQGQGSTFWFSIVLDKQAGAEKPQPIQHLAGRRVIAADNSPAGLDGIKDHLDAWRCQTVWVRDGMDALDRIRTAVLRHEPFDVALIGRLPDMDGLALARKIRNDPLMRRTGIVLLTEAGFCIRRQDLAECGVTECLRRPVRPSTLAAGMIAVLGCVEEQCSGQDCATPAPCVPEEVRKRAKVLVVEDNDINQVVAEGIFRALGYAVEIAANGQEALGLLQRTDYDIVFMDLQMPGMDGIEAARKIRDAGSNVIRPDVPIVAMTAHAMQRDREKSLAAGMDDYLAKPVRPDDVARVLERFLAPQNKEQTERRSS